MSYTLRVHFTGILAFVKSTTPANGYRVLIPDTLLGKYDDEGKLPKADDRKALDGVQLKRHVPYIRDPAGGLLLRLDGHRVSFRLPGKAGGMPVLKSSNCQLIQLDRVSTDHDVDGRFVSGSSWGKRTLSGLVELKGGSLTPRTGGGTWSIPTNLGGTYGRPGCLAKWVAWELPNLNAPVSMIVQGLTNRTSIQIIDLGWKPGTSEGGSHVDLIVANTYLDPHSPGKVKEGQDPHFRWFYEFLDQGSKRAVKKKLGTKGKLPFPVGALKRTKTGSNKSQPFKLLGESGSCKPVQLPDQDF